MERSRGDRAHQRSGSGEHDPRRSQMLLVDNDVHSMLQPYDAAENFVRFTANSDELTSTEIRFNPMRGADL